MKLNDVSRVLEAYYKGTNDYAADARINLVDFDLSAIRNVIGPHFGDERPNPPWLDHDPYYLLVYDIDSAMEARLAAHLPFGSTLRFDLYDYFLTSYGDGSPLEFEP